jgi:AcrR family transcriptional regulator
MTILQTDEPRRGRGRPRTPGAEERIMDAALEEYGEHGWSGFTMDGVARRAGVGKSTVYLRWQDKDTLLIDAVSRRGSAVGPVDTGTIEGDLHQLAVTLFRFYRDAAGWATLRIYVDVAGAPDRLRGFLDTIGAMHTEFVEEIVARGIQRGEVPAGASGATVAEVVYGAAMMHSMRIRLEGGQLTDEEIEQQAHELVELALCGARA